MQKYKIYNSEKVLVDEFVSSNLLEKKFLQRKYSNCYIYKSCCFTGKNETMNMQFFLEIKKETDNLQDLLEVKTETIKVIDFIANEFEIKVEYIRIFFNGSNGFYIVVPNIALGLYNAGQPDVYLKIGHIVKYIKQRTMCDYIITENYGVDLMHLEFETLDINTKFYTHRISRDNLAIFNVSELLDYFRDIQREKFMLGVRESKSQPEEKLKSILESYITLQSNEELVSAKRSFFNLNKSKNLNTSENLQGFRMKIANENNYNLANNYLLYIYNAMLDAINNCPKEEISELKITWLKLMIIDFITMSNQDKGLGSDEDYSNYYMFSNINGSKEYIMQLHISNHLVINNERNFCISYDNTKMFGDYTIPESEFEFEHLLEILSNIDYILNEKT